MLLQMFEKAKRGTNIVDTVTLFYERECGSRLLRHTVDPLGQPRRTRVPAPHSAFIKQWFRDARRDGFKYTESTIAELFEFENADSTRKLELFVWTAEERDDHSLSYVFLIRIVDA